MKTKLFILFLTAINAFATSIPPNASIADLQAMFKQNKLTCTQVVSYYLNRIRQYNLTIEQDQAPINAISEINPDIFTNAARLDQLQANNQISGSLFCIPVIVKDNVDVRGMTTSAGSYALIGTKPLQDAALVQSLKQQNAIILAKTSMDELASGVWGISSRDGRVGNAYDTRNNPGGSSAGSGAGIASNFAVLAIGTDNSGSVRIPAAFNGIYGLRPTNGLINKNGIFPLGNIDGTPGPMARNVTDLATMLDTISDKPKDQPNYTSYLKKTALAGKKIAIIDSVNGKPAFTNMPKAILAVFKQAEDNLIRQGVNVVHVNLPTYNLDRKLNMAGTVDNVNNYLNNNLSTRNSFKDICDSNRTRIYGDMKSCRSLVAKIKPLKSQGYNKALANIKYNQEYLHNIIIKNKLDGLLLPISISGSATYNNDQLQWFEVIAPNSGLPAIVIQIGHDQENMPIAMEIVGDQYMEGKLISIAYAYEQHYTHFTPPLLHKSTRFDDWSIAKLNNLFVLIGKNAYNTIFIHNNKTFMTPNQSIEITKTSIDQLSDS